MWQGSRGCSRRRREGGRRTIVHYGKDVDVLDRGRRDGLVAVAVESEMRIGVAGRTVAAGAAGAGTDAGAEVS